VGGGRIKLFPNIELTYLAPRETWVQVDEIPLNLPAEMEE